MLVYLIKDYPFLQYIPIAAESCHTEVEKRKIVSDQEY